MGATEDIDGVQLQKPHPGNHPAQMPSVDTAAGPWLGKALSGESHSPGKGR